MEKASQLQKTDPRELGALEATWAGNVVTPAVDIFESEDRIIVLADMPGVERSDLKIDLHEGILTLTGRPSLPGNDNEVEVLREYQPGIFQRKFTLSEAIDQEKIEAKLVDGVLKLELPKAAHAKPRQIKVKS